MYFRYSIRRIKNAIKSTIFKVKHRTKQKYECPVCHYFGPFRDINPETGLRENAKCPNCGSLERHRLQILVMNEVLQSLDVSQMKMLHFSPEPYFRYLFSKCFGQYDTADLYRQDVDYKVDIQKLPFESNSYDFVFASHVLEHIPDDGSAIREINRILKPGSIAVLPVPVVCETTVEYPEANPNDSNHVRVPGIDYFDRYKKEFSRVKLYDSSSFSPKYQLVVYEDRTIFPMDKIPLRPKMDGEKHPEFVPVCYV